MVEAASRELSDGDLSVEIVVAVELEKQWVNFPVVNQSSDELLPTTYRGCQSWTNPLPFVRSPLVILEGVRAGTRTPSAPCTST